jgi:dTDP-4-dehydrorhamnose reductase
MSNDTLSERTAWFGDDAAMDRRDTYLFKAAELSELARNENYAVLKVEFESLARAYLRLADQAERNSHPDLFYDMPPKDEVTLLPEGQGDEAVTR